jgi:hypothetical protein
MLQKETAQQTQQQVVQVWGIGTDGKISDVHIDTDRLAPNDWRLSE